MRRSAKRGDAKPGAKPEARRAPATKKKAAEPTPAAKAAADVSAVTKAAASSAEAAPKTAQRARTTPKRKVPPAGYAAPASGADDAPASGADVVATTIQAAAELAQIGLAVGRQTLRSMLDRLPKP